MTTVKLAQLLLRRKELSEKVDQLRRIKQDGLFKTVVRRMPVAEGTDEVTATVPQVTMAEVTRAYDYAARSLRNVDAAIQQANWGTDVEVQPECMKDYDPAEPAAGEIPVVHETTPHQRRNF